LATWAYFLSFSNLSFGEGAAVGNILIALTLVFAVFYLRSMRNSIEEAK
jgi:multiple sugar transport system permease protein